MKNAALNPWVLTKSQAACLMILRNPGFSQRRIAGAAKLDLKKTETALRKLAELGLATRSNSKLWTATATGEICVFETVADPRVKEAGRLRPTPSSNSIWRTSRNTTPGPRSPDPAADVCSICWIGRRAPPTSHASQGCPPERVGQLFLHLQAHGRIVFVDPDHPSWPIKRGDDESAALARDETRVLSAVPAERAADVSSLTMVKTLARCDIEGILDRLVEGGLVETVESPSGAPAFRLTAAALKHPKYVPSKRLPPPPPLPVRSDRVCLVLQTIADADALRIRDVKHLTKIPQRSINALMQYLKRKRLVVKVGDGFDDPYRLTKQGDATLTEMSLRRAA